ncbi:MAG: hypothetical protein EP329_07405 [Deltaproteobacteria bacterium]|nr:MAG: hypothetical protein EP329_07405 [Deltaproteobacteria bacterium]
MLALVWSAVAAGCASSPYRESLDAWTRAEDFYQLTEVTSAARATLLAEPFRRAYVEEYTEVFALTPEQHDALLEAEVEDARGGWTVVIALYTSDPEWNDLDPRREMWSVRLEGPNGWLPVSRVRPLVRDNPSWRRFYPYFAAHYRLYELRFERGVGPEPLARPGEELTLVVAGAPGQMRLAWRAP